jgi:hypothetical protein
MRTGANITLLIRLTIEQPLGPSAKVPRAVNTDMRPGFDIEVSAYRKEAALVVVAKRYRSGEPPLKEQQADGLGRNEPGTMTKWTDPLTLESGYPLIGSQS